MAGEKEKDAGIELRKIQVEIDGDDVAGAIGGELVAFARGVGARRNRCPDDCAS